MRNRRSSVLVTLLALCAALPGFSQAPPEEGSRPEPASAPAATAFVHVNLLTMESDRLLADMTVVVRGERIDGFGPSGAYPLPPGALILDGTGKTLMPGLTDAHVHLDAFVGARPDFGDAPLYLASGVTTVINLRGGPEHLAWRERIREGRLLAPNLYTSGEFVNEPRVRTPEEVQREVHRQAQEGYDLIKYHQVVDERTGRYSTTTWLDRQAFLAVGRAAAAEHLPLLGHGPYNLGLEAALEAHECLAHVGEFNPLYFLPSRHMQAYTLAGLGALLILLGLPACWALAALLRRARRAAAPVRSDALSRARRLTLVLLLIAIAGFVAWVLLLPGGLLFGNVPLLRLFTAGSAAAAVLSAWVVGLALVRGKGHTDGPWGRIQRILAALGALALAVWLLHWVPVAWRATDRGMADAARRCREAGIWVQSTLVVYDNALLMCGPGGRSLLEDPAFRCLPAPVQKEWSEVGPPLPPALASLFRRYPEFTRRMAAALHREGVPMMAGTDAMGIPMVAPGVSLQKELRLLAASGFTPFEAIWAATVAPARYLGRESEFGTVLPGRRADLLLVEGDPLKDLGCLQHPAGVMVRGVWLQRERLDSMLASLGGAP